MDNKLHQGEIDAKTYSFQSANQLIFANQKWGSALSFDCFKWALRTKLDDGGGQIDYFDINSPLGSFSTSAWLNSWKNISVGLLLGINYSPIINKEYDKKFKATFSWGTAIKYYGDLIHGEISIYQGLLNASSIEIETSSGAYKNFPIEFNELSQTAKMGIHQKQKFITSSFRYRKIFGESIAQKLNSLPVIPAFIDYQIGLDSRFKSIYSEFKYTWGDASIEAYDSHEVRDRFLMADSLEYKDFYGLIKYDNDVFTVGLFGEIVKSGSTGKNYVDAYPLSAWTIFMPIAYRYKEGHFDYYTIGLEYSYLKKWNNKNKTLLGIKTSYIQVDFEYLSEEKKIVVVIPVYINDTRKRYDPKIILSELEFKHSLQIKKAKLSLTLGQLIPVILNKKFVEVTELPNNYQIANSSNGSSEDDLDIKSEKFQQFELRKVLGGSSVAFDLEVPF